MTALIIRPIVSKAPNKAFQRDAIAVSHLLQNTQKMRHSNSAPEQQRYAAQLNYEAHVLDC